MKNISYFIFMILWFFLYSGDLFAQTVKITGEIRPRYEYRHGYKTLFPDDKNPASYISQRTRFNAYFSNESFEAYVSFQNVMVWGDVDQLNVSSANGIMIHEAWGQYRFCDKFSLKVGRQEIVYDDQRIFGNVGWAQQARSHDAAVLKFFFGENNKLDVGFAYNAIAESLYELDYFKANYKTFQYAHYHGDFGKSGISVLLLNNGLTYDANSDTSVYEQEIAFSQTIGARYTYNGKKIKANAAYYHQFGKNKLNNSLQAFYFAVDLKFIVSSWFSIGVGTEYLSGTETIYQKNPKETDHSFSPLYGTNHKFNGWMDYFYVGNYFGQNGLVDIYLPLNFKIKNWNFGLIPHYFQSAATVSSYSDETQKYTDYSNNLGTEIDFILGYTFSKSVNIQAGYSQMFATETMQVIKYPDNVVANYYSGTNNWAWIMLTFKPTFFDTSNKNK